MRWKAKPRRKRVKNKQIPNIGDIKISNSFLFFPKKINGYWYWLENITTVYEWQKYDKWMRRPMFPELELGDRFTKLIKIEETGWKMKELKINKIVEC